MDLVLDVLLDSLTDTAELVPFLFVTYLVLEILEHASGHVAERVVARAGAAGPVVGALLGAIPQCGFSAMAATLFAGGVVSVGTLVAVILSTSDELIPVFLANGAAGRLMPLLLLKVLVGLVVGLAIDAVARLAGGAASRRSPRELCDDAACDCGTVERIAAGHTGDTAHMHDHDQRLRWGHIVRCATTHTAQVTLFILLVSLALGLLIEGVGEGRLAAILGAHPVRATFLAGLVGLIPNCGVSVAIAQLYLDGSLAAGPMVAGLLVSGGVGLLVLFRTDHNPRQDAGIAVLVYVVGVVCGLVVGASGIVF